MNNLMSCKVETKWDSCLCGYRAT